MKPYGGTGAKRKKKKIQTHAYTHLCLNNKKDTTKQSDVSFNYEALNVRHKKKEGE